MTKIRSFGLVLAAFAAASVFAEASSKSLKLNAESNGKEFVIKKGGLITVSLASNPSTGYSLVFLSDGSEPWTLSSRAFVTPKTNAPMAGAPGTQIFRFRTDKLGVGQLAILNVRRFDLKGSLVEAEPWSVRITVK